MAMTSYLDLCAEAVKKCRTAIFEFIKRLEDSLSETKSYLPRLRNISYSFHKRNTSLRYTTTIKFKEDVTHDDRF